MQKVCQTGIIYTTSFSLSFVWIVKERPVENPENRARWIWQSNGSSLGVGNQTFLLERKV